MFPFKLSGTKQQYVLRALGSLYALGNNSSYKMQLLNLVMHVLQQSFVMFSKIK